MKNAYIKRILESKIKEYASSFSVVSLTGPRQSGKTTLLKHLFGRDYSYASLDDLGTRDMAVNDPKMFLETWKPPLIIDEAQYSPGLFSQIKIKVDDKPRQKGMYLITGSQQFLLMKNFTETLAGRIGILSLPPLSLDELSAFTGLSDTLDLFEQACLKGSFPQLHIEKTARVYGWYEGYLQTYIERDVKTLYNIGNLLSFSSFVKILASRCGQVLNMSALSSDIGVAVSTIKSWISILEASGIIYLLYPYHANIRTRLAKSPKAYFMDTGLVCHLNNITTKKQLFASPLLGFLFENYCIMEVVKNCKNRGERERIFFFRTSKGVEVDLVVEGRAGYALIEIKSGMRIDSSITDSIKAAMRLNKNFAKARGYVLTFGKETLAAGETIEFISPRNLLSRLRQSS
ncbi:MAG TPA: ATP-binding protein [bacterium]|nr:ATP-binding protein [bacterium]